MTIHDEQLADVIDVSTGEPRLVVGLRHGHTYEFPFVPAEGTERVLLPREGTLWTWTTQGFPPPLVPHDGGDFVPYAVGYVEFDGFLHIEGVIADPVDSGIQVGQQMTVIEHGSGGYAFTATAEQEDAR